MSTVLEFNNVLALFTESIKEVKLVVAVEVSTDPLKLAGVLTLLTVVEACKLTA